MSFDTKEYLLFGPRGFWPTIGFFWLLGVVGPLFTLRRGDLGDIRLYFGLSAIAFALAALRLFLKASDRYDGPAANANIWRVIGILAIAGLPTLGAFFYVYADRAPPTMGAAALASIAVSLVQAVVGSVLGLMVPDKKQFPDPR